MYEPPAKKVGRLPVDAPPLRAAKPVAPTSPAKLPEKVVHVPGGLPVQGDAPAPKKNQKKEYPKPITHGDYIVRPPLVRDVALRLQLNPDESLIWYTPPISYELYDKLQKSGQRAVVLMPYWKFGEVPKCMVVKKYYYNKGTKMFDQVDASMGGSPWPIYAVLLDGHGAHEGHDAADFPRTTSAKRRFRRKYKVETVC